MHSDSQVKGEALALTVGQQAQTLRRVGPDISPEYGSKKGRR